MSNLILVRHGQSQWNKERRFTGWVDIDLTDQGKLEAENAGKLINKLNLEFHAYFTSRLKRASNTLKVILEILDKKNADIIESDSLISPVNIAFFSFLKVLISCFVKLAVTIFSASSAVITSSSIIDVNALSNVF